MAVNTEPRPLQHTGGPAFPQALSPHVDTGGAFIGCEGMSLRDYFAGQVISQCHITVEKDAEADPMLVEAYAFRYARTAYAIADAMLVERAKFKK